MDRKINEAKVAMQFDGRRNLEHFLPHVVGHYTLGIWLLPISEGTGEQMA